MAKLRKRVFYLMIPVALILLTEGLIYYSSSGLTTLEVILCSLENVFMAFIARPTLSSFNAFKNIDESYSGLEKLITHLYGVLIILAPILTTTAVVAGFQSYILEFVYMIKPALKPRMFIIGDGSMGKDIALKYAGQYSVQYMMPEDVSNQERLQLLRNHVFAYPVDYSRMEDIMKEKKLEEARCIVLNFKAWFDNNKTATDIIEYLIRNSREGQTIPLFIVDAPTVYRDIFDRIYYQGLCKKNGKPETVLKVSFVNWTQENAKEFFKDPQLTQTPDGKHHIILAGLGAYGQAMLVELFRYMIEHDLWGTIEVFDQQIEKKLDDLAFSKEIRLAYDAFRHAETAKNAVGTYEFKIGSRTVTENFYQAKIGELKFSKILEEIMNEGDITEVFLCIGDTAVNFEYYRMMSVYAEEHSNVKMYFRVSDELAEPFKTLELDSDMVRILPDHAPDIELSI